MHSIAAYALRCYDSEVQAPTGEKYRVLNDIRSHDMFDLLKEHIDNNTDSLVVEDSSKHVFTFSNVEFDRENRQVHGWMLAGSYGIRSDIIDIETGKTDFKKAQKNAEMIFHYFHILVPEGVNEGIALMHSYRGVGIKTLFLEHFQKHFTQKTKLHCQMNPLAYEQAYAQWLQGEAKEIRLSRFVGMPDITDQIERLGHREQELVIKPPRKKGFGPLSGFFDKNSDPGNIVEALAEHCEQVKTTVEVDGKRRTFTVSGARVNAISEIDIDGEVKLVQGNLDRQSVYEFCQDVLKEFVSSMYPGVKGII